MLPELARYAPPFPPLPGPMKCKNIDGGNQDDNNNDHATYFFFKVCIKKKLKGGNWNMPGILEIFNHSILKKG